MPIVVSRAVPEPPLHLGANASLPAFSPLIQGLRGGLSGKKAHRNPHPKL